MSGSGITLHMAVYSTEKAKLVEVYVYVQERVQTSV